MSEDLLIEIARCPVVQSCLNDGCVDHPCNAIVQLQHSESFTEHQVPEPWSGRITESPLLFVSSNPSISENDVFPTGDWSNDHIIDFFNNRFGGGRQQWIKGGTKGLRTDGNYGKVTMFWAGIRRRAMELLQRDVTPGTDYALTEVVHCKSKSEHGVAEALAHCTSRYLQRVLGAAHALVVIVLGSRARQVMISEFDIPNGVNVYGPTEICGKQRLVTFLPHPNARMQRTFKACLSNRELAKIREFMRTNRYL
jgi:hypothetical protein